ncbi:peptidoglycan-binding protein [Patescibacteria group bacterium]
MIKKSLLLVILLFLVVAPTAGAQERGFLPNCDQTVYRTTFYPDIDILPIEYEQDPEMYGEITSVKVNEKCGVDDFIQLFINLADWGLSIIAAVTIFFFVWGAFDWIISAGRPAWVEGGKKKMAGAVIGMLVVLTAWIFVGFYVGALAGNWDGLLFPNEDAKFQRVWFGSSDSCKDEYSNTGCSLSDGYKDGCGDPKNTANGPIAQIQARLMAKACGPNRASGCYGADTEAAVKRFQSTNGLGITGVVKEPTDTALKDSYSLSCGQSSDEQQGCCRPQGVSPSTANNPCFENVTRAQCNEGKVHNNAVYNIWTVGACDTALLCPNVGSWPF